MKIKTTYTIFLAASLVGGISCQRLLQGVPQTGLDATAPVGSADPAQVTDGTGVEKQLVQSLEADPQVAVVGSVDLGEVMCDSLVVAEDAVSLSFVIHEETLVAERSSYTFTPGGIFEDGLDRHVWAGVVTSPVRSEDEAAPRTVSMTWDNACNVETFLLKVTKRNMDGTTSVVKSVPCGGVDSYTCLVEVRLKVAYSDEEVISEEDVSEGIPADSTAETDGSSEEAAQGTSGRRLQDSSTTVIDVMMLYTAGAMSILGDIDDSQMQTTVLERLTSTAEAFANSEIAITFNPVYIGLAPFEEIGIMRVVRETFATDEEVGHLRDRYGADLVQLVGSFEDACGGSFFIADELSPFSVVKSTCLDDNLHNRFFGFSLGGDTVRTNSGSAYSQGLNSCTSANPFRTILTFPCSSSAPTINYFSNPDVTYFGTPTGTPARDNARAIESYKVQVSNYRDSIPTPTPSPTSPPTPSPTAVPDAYLHVGCYGDSSRHRVLSGVSVKRDPVMTTERCAGICEGSAYFGTEFSNECFCGPQADDPTSMGERTCDHPCAGDDSQTCGGYNAISLYEYATTEIIRYRELGCFVDNKHDRVFSGISKKGDPAMTTEVCGAICQSAPFFGTEYGDECFCASDDELGMDGGRTTCDFPCAGDSSQICGGRNAILIYQNDDPVMPSTPTYLGCWGDSRNGRIMQHKLSDDAMTNDLCEEHCAGFPVYGTQFAVECWCGEKTTIFGAYGRSTACTMECAGDADQTCGGYDAMDVWER